MFVKATTPDNERTKLSAAFSSTASCTKLPVFLIVPRKTELFNYEPPEDYMISIPHKLNYNFDKLYFIFDSARYAILHHKYSITELKLNNIEPIKVTPRITNLLQHADVDWFSLLKAAYHELWQN